MKKKISLFPIFIISLCAVIYSVLTYGQAVLHSDTATATLLAQSQLNHHSIIPQSWCYVNGDVWLFSLNLFTLPFSALLDNQILARCLASVAVFLFIWLCMYVFSRKILNNNTWLIGLPLMLVCLQGNADMILYQCAYSLFMALFCIGCFLVYNIICSKQVTWNYVVFFPILLILCASGSRNLAEFSLPLWGTLHLLAFMELCKSHFKEFKKFVCSCIVRTVAIFVPTMVGQILYRWIRRHFTVYTSSIGSLKFEMVPQNWWNNFISMLQNLFVNFGFVHRNPLQDVLAIVLCVLVVFLMPILQLICIKKESKSTQFLNAFCFVHNFIFVLLAIFFNKTESRWLLSSIFLFILVSANYMINHFNHNMFYLGWNIVILAQCVILLQTGIGWRDTLNSRRAFADTLVEQGITKGYASYWNAYSTQLYSDLQLQMGGILVSPENISCYRCLVDSQVFEPQDSPSFLLLTQDEYSTLENVLPTFGEPCNRYELNQMIILEYDYDIVINFDDWMASLIH